MAELPDHENIAEAKSVSKPVSEPVAARNDDRGAAAERVAAALHQVETRATRCFGGDPGTMAAKPENPVRTA